MTKKRRIVSKPKHGDIKCKYDKIVAIKDLKPHPRNPNKHSQSQLENYRTIMRENGVRTPVRVSKLSGFMTKGHGQTLAAQLEGWTHVPVEYQDYQNEELEFADLVADNALARQAELDLSVINVAIQDLGPELNLELLALPDFEVERADKDSSDSSDSDPVIEKRVFSDQEIIDDAFTYFRKAGFPYADLELFEMKQELNRLANVALEDCVRSTIGYRIPDTYHRHRVHASANGMASPFDAFNDDVKLRKALRMDLEAQKIKKDAIPFINLVNGVQSCSNFRPAFARMLYEQYSKAGARVFDSSTGYGGRLTGFLASHCSEYFGTDPNRPTFEANKMLAADLARDKDVHLFNDPIEDLDISAFKGALDFAFTSPPYFSKELYADDDKQSWVRYPTYEEWINRFLRVMLEKQYAVLHEKSYNIVNIEDVKIKSKKFALVQPTIEIAQAVGFSFVRLEKFPLQTRTFVVDGEKTTQESFESVIVLYKD